MKSCWIFLSAKIPVLIFTQQEKVMLFSTASEREINNPWIATKFPDLRRILATSCMKDTCRRSTHLCLNQPELLQLIPSRRVPKCGVVNCIIYLNWSMLGTCPISWSSPLLALVSCINTTLSLALLYLVKWHFTCALFSHCRPNFTLTNKMLLTWHQCSNSSARGNRLHSHSLCCWLFRPHKGTWEKARQSISY